MLHLQYPESVLMLLIVKINSEAHVAFVKSTTHNNPLWRLPGGGRKEDESLEASASRHTQQEMGLTVAEFHSESLLVKYRPLSFPDNPVGHKQYLFVGKTEETRGMFEEHVLYGREKLTTKLFPVKNILDYLFNPVSLDRMKDSGIIRPHAVILKKHLGHLQDTYI